METNRTSYPVFSFVYVDMKNVEFVPVQCPDNLGKGEEGEEEFL